MSTTEPNGQNEPTPTGARNIPYEESIDATRVTDADTAVMHDEQTVESSRGEDRAGEPAVHEPTDVEPGADDTYNESIVHENVAPVDERVDGVRVETVDESDYAPPREDPIPAPAATLYPAATPNDAYPAPIYVQAPTPPVTRGNRGFGILVGILATVVFAIIYAVVALVVASILNSSDAVHAWITFLPQYVYWVPVIGFFVAFAIVAAIINRAGWWSWVLGGFFVGIFTYFSYIGASLLSAQAWTLTAEEAVRFLGTQWTFPLALGAAITAREVPIWFGAWISSRGRKVSERNVVARREYDRQLAEGPLITRS